MSHAPRALFAFLLAGAALSACGTVSGSLGGSGPTASQASELAASLQNEVEAALPALTVSQPGMPHNFPTIAGCPTLGSTTDSDADGIPDDQLRTFADPPCTLAGYRGGSLGLSGTALIEDLDLANPGGYRLTLTDLTWAFTDSASTRTYTEIRNGTRNRTGNAGAVSVVTDLVTQRLRPSRATATVTLNTTTNFNSSGGTVVVGQALPSGQVSVAGTLVWHRSTENWNLTVTTQVPLQYDATCTTTPQRIKAGIATLVGTVNSAPGVLIITWTACGTEPTRQWNTSS